MQSRHITKSQALPTTCQNNPVQFQVQAERRRRVNNPGRVFSQALHWVRIVVKRKLILVLSTIENKCPDKEVFQSPHSLGRVEATNRDCDFCFTFYF